MKKMHKVLMMVLILAMAMLTMALPAGAAGAEIVISTPEELMEFALDTQDGTLGNCAGVTVKLGANIDMSGYKWYHRNAEGTVVCDYRIPAFAGVLDGNGYTISNLSYLDEYAAATDVVKLAFITNASGTLKNVKIDGITAATVAPARFAGLVDCYTYTGDNYAEGCTVSNLSLTSDAQIAFAGMFWKALDIGYVKDCHVNGFTVVANGVVDGDNNGRSAGFVGTGGESTPFTNCTVSNVSVTLNSTGKYIAGFIAGTGNGASYDNCDVINFTLTAKGRISSFGGFAGYTAGSGWKLGATFKNCDVKGLKVTSEDVISAGAGGFIGNIYGAYGCEFNNCTTEGSIEADAYAGGFVGWLYGRNANCYADFIDCAAAVSVKTNYEAGGFIGKHAPANGMQIRVSYDNCTASGDVFGIEADGLILDDDAQTVDGIIGGTYNYDPEDGENNNVAEGYRALNNGDGTWTVFADNGREVVEIAFYRWNDELNDYENWRTVEVFKGVDFLDAASDNALNPTDPGYRFNIGLDELDLEADDATEQFFLHWTDVPFGTEEILNEETVIEGDMTVYAAYGEEDEVLGDEEEPEDKDEVLGDEENPNTGDAVILYAALTAVSAAGAVVLRKKVK